MPPPFANDVRRRYHFRCIDLSEGDAEEIRESSPILLWRLAQAHPVFHSESYVCPACHEKTGARTISEYFACPSPFTPLAARRGCLCCYRCTTNQYDTWLSSHLLAWATICLSLRYGTYTPTVCGRSNHVGRATSPVVSYLVCSPCLVKRLLAVAS